MLSFNNIGKLGRLGNQMFQYAALCGISQKIGTSCCCPYRFVVDPPISISECFYLGHALDHMNNKVDHTYREMNFFYDDSFNLIEKNKSVDLYGYFQSEKYFSHCKDLIRNQFTFKKHITDSVDNFISETNLNMDNYISVHIRRGDYLNLQDYHPIQSSEYYIKSMEYFEGKDFIIFSDDIDWCKQQPYFSKNNTVYSEMDEHQDLCLMSKCSGHIIANSSFSWWGAWLSGNETIAPLKWFGLNGPKNWNDIYCENWILM